MDGSKSDDSSTTDTAPGEPELDLEDAGGPLSLVVVAILTALLVAIVGVPLLGLGWTQALSVGAAAGVVAAVAAALGARHATPE